MTASDTAWRRFWNRGGIWKAIVLAAVYYAVYELLGRAVGALIGDEGGPLRGEPGSASDVLLATALPIVLGCIVLIAFAASVGWVKDLFRRETLSGRRWMWTGVIVVLLINVCALASVDVASAGGALIGAWMLTGLFVGFAEEVLTRGFVVRLARSAGHGEIVVALASAGVFAALHLGNVFTTDQGLAVTLLQVVYTFFFGIVMYLALRVTRTLIAPILIHASTDPTLFLYGAHPTEGNPLALVPAFSTYLVIALGAVLLIVLLVSERRRRAALESSSAGDNTGTVTNDAAPPA